MFKYAYISMCIIVTMAVTGIRMRGILWLGSYLEFALAKDAARELDHNEGAVRAVRRRRGENLGERARLRLHDGFDRRDLLNELIHVPRQLATRLRSELICTRGEMDIREHEIRGKGIRKEESRDEESRDEESRDEESRTDERRDEESRENDI